MSSGTDGWWRERRKHPRAPLQMAVQMQHDGHGETVEAVNLSAGGLFVLRREPLAAGTRVKLAFLAPGSLGRVSIEGAVTRAQPADPIQHSPAGMAIAFRGADAALMDALDWTVRDVLAWIQGRPAESFFPARPPRAEEAPPRSQRVEAARSGTEGEPGPAPGTAAGASVAPAPPAAPAPRARQSFRVSFATQDAFRAEWATHLAMKGLFVPTDREVGFGEQVDVELVLPGDPPTVKLRTEVVRGLSRDLGSNKGSGIVVQVSEASAAEFERVRRLARSLGLDVAAAPVPAANPARPASGCEPERGGAGTAPRKDRSPVPGRNLWGEAPFGSGLEGRAAAPVAPVFRVRFASDDEFLAEYSANLARSGLFVHTEEAVAPGTRVQVELELPRIAQPIRLSAEVVHRIPRRGLGLDLRDAEGVARIKALAQERLALRSPPAPAPSPASSPVPAPAPAPAPSPAVVPAPPPEPPIAAVVPPAPTPAPPPRAAAAPEQEATPREPLAAALQRALREGRVAPHDQRATVFRHGDTLAIPGAELCQDLRELAPALADEIPADPGKDDLKQLAEKLAALGVLAEECDGKKGWLWNVSVGAAVHRNYFLLGTSAVPGEERAAWDAPSVPVRAWPVYGPKR